MTDERCEECAARLTGGEYGLCTDCGYYKPGLAVQNVYEAVRDLLWRATQYGTTEDGDTAHYLLTKGTVHRLVGAMIAAGESAPLRASLDTQTTEGGRDAD